MNNEKDAFGLTESEMERALAEACVLFQNFERVGLPTVAGLTLALAAVIVKSSADRDDFALVIESTAEFLKCHAEKGYAIAWKDIETALAKLVEKGRMEVRIVNGEKRYRPKRAN